MDAVPLEVAMRESQLYVIFVFVLAVMGMLLGVVYAFLRHIKGREERDDQRDERQAQTIKEVGVACHSFQREEAVQNRAMLQRATSAIEQNTIVMQNVSRWVDEQRNKP